MEQTSPIRRFTFIDSNRTPHSSDPMDFASDDHDDNNDDDHYLPLHRACQREDVARVGRLLYHRFGGVDINETDTHHRTPLIIAAKRACAAIVFQLLDHGGVHLDAKDLMGKTALLYATEKNAHAIVLHLLARDADPNIPDGTGATPLVVAGKFGHFLVARHLVRDSRTWIDHADKYGATALWYAASNGNEEILELLLQHHARPRMSDSLKKTPLIAATENGHLECVDKLLMDGRIDLEATDNHGKTALRYACELNHIDIVKILVDHGANANARTTIDRVTILMAVSQLGHSQVVEVLLQHCEINLRATDYADRTALYYACEHENVFKKLVEHGASVHSIDRGGKTILMRAAQIGNVFIINTILSRTFHYDAVSDIDRMDHDGFTAFSYACVAGHVDAARRLLKEGASPVVPDEDDVTPLMLAAMHGRAEIVALLAPLASPEPGLDLRDYRGMTALMKACSRGHLEIVQTLLRHGASLLIKDHQDMTALMKACDNGRQDIVSILLNTNAANVNAVDKRHQTALYYACKEEAVECVEMLLEHSADPSIANAAGVTPLILSGINGNMDVANLLLPRLLGPQLDAQDKRGQTALYHACEGNHTELAICLLKSGADPIIVSNHLITPLMLASSRGNDEIVEEILKGAARYRIDDVDVENMTALCHAAGQGLDETVGLLLRHHANPSHRSEDGATPLFIAAEHGYLDVVKRLVSYFPTPQTKKRYVNIPDNDGRTPLHQASANGYSSVVAYLLDHGANALATDIHRNTPLILAAARKQLTCAKVILQKCGPEVVAAADNVGKSALYYAIYHHLLDMMKLLMNHGALLQPLLDNKLIWSSGFPQYTTLRMIRELVDNFGMDVNATNREGKSALFLLSHSFGNKYDSIAFLLSRGANPWLATPGGILPISGATTARVHDLLSNAMMEHERFQTLEKARTLCHISSRLDQVQSAEKTRATKRRKCLEKTSGVIKDRLEAGSSVPQVAISDGKSNETLKGVVSHLMGKDVNDDIFHELYKMMRVQWD